MTYTYEYYQASADYLKKLVPWTPDIGIILGSGLGPFAETLQDKIVVPYGDIPNFLVSTAPYQAGKLIFGTLNGKKLVCLSGRFHSYEGYSYEQLTIPVRVLKLLGIQTLILTNAAGAVNKSYKPGDVMVLSDHIKLNGDSPMRGPNVPEFGPRFFDVSKLYTPALRALALEKAKGSGLTVHEGVYMFFTGPQYETPAEIRAARTLGADAVGMSTVTEALTAGHCGLPLLAMALITNMAAGVLDQPLSEEEVGETAGRAAELFSGYLASIIEAL